MKQEQGMEKEQSRLDLIQRLEDILSLAKSIYDNNYEFTRDKFYGGIWNEAMGVLQGKQKATPYTSRMFLKAFIVFNSVSELKGVLAYFDREKEAWEEKVKGLFHANTEDEFDSLCYEFYAGAQLRQDSKEIFFCNMESDGSATTDSLCEYFTEPRLFTECKNLFGVAKGAIDGNLRKANRQIRSTMRKIDVSSPVGLVFLDLPEAIDPESEAEIREKLDVAIQRLKQCDSIHFLAITYYNIKSEEGGSSSYAVGRLVINPRFRDMLYYDKESLMSVYPRFRIAYFLNEDGTFDYWDFVDDVRGHNVFFERIFLNEGGVSYI
ncbi:hypothetical protein LAV82_15995 [Bacillus sp. ILBB4]|nr:hypothetical protein [Bacillus sp. ILBB4]